MSRMNKMVGVIIPAVAMLAILLSLNSCSKNSFKLFDDLDCIVIENFVHIELPLTDISPTGGKIKLDANVYMEAVSYKLGEEVGKEFLPLPFEANIVKAPLGYTLEVIDGSIILTAPANHGEGVVPIEIVISAEGVTKSFILTQKPRTYDVGGTIV